jgi:hypothetical protein
MTKTIQFSKSGSIDPEKVKTTVYNRIDFDLPEWLWDKIDSAFGECWNEEIGLRGWVYEGQIEKFIYKKLQEENILFDYSKTERIVKIIYDYIGMSGGFLDD